MFLQSAVQPDILLEHSLYALNIPYPWTSWLGYSLKANLTLLDEKFIYQKALSLQQKIISKSSKIEYIYSAKLNSTLVYRVIYSIRSGYAQVLLAALPKN